jgi:hypothetical protein
VAHHAKGDGNGAVQTQTHATASAAAVTSTTQIIHIIGSELQLLALPPVGLLECGGQALTPPPHHTTASTTPHHTTPRRGVALQSSHLGGCRNEPAGSSCHQVLRLTFFADAGFSTTVGIQLCQLDSTA